MSENTLNKSMNRRNVIRFLAGVPALPLATGSVATLLTGCGSDNNSSTIGDSSTNHGNGLNNTAKTIKSVEFVGMPAPTLANPAEMATVHVASKLKASFTDGTNQEYKLAYQPFFKTGDKISDGKGGTIIAGGYFDINNKPIMDSSVLASTRQFFSDCPDGSSLLTVKGAKVAGVQGNTVFAVVQFEYTTLDQGGNDMYGKLPSPIAVVTLDQNPQTGELKVVKYHNVDTSKANGLWITCGASLSPWNTHLSSEEYEPDAFKAKSDAGFKAFSKNLFGDENKANPYHYGHLPEIIVNADGTGIAKKHYCLGRISHELIQVMPDKRTALMGDDFTNGGLFMFVADKEADLSAGNLYVAKVTQTSPKDGPAKDSQFSVKWIHLGHASSGEIEALANMVQPTDLMDVKYEDPKDPSYKKIGLDGTTNWVKMATNSKLPKDKLEQAAAFLETHRYAALQGASMAFTKMEGTTVNIKDKIAYSAMSRIEKSMTKGEYDVQVAQLKSGAVYAHELKGGQVDHNGKAINSEWVSTRMYVPQGLAGEDLSADMKTVDAVGNYSNIEKISCPDNLKFSEKFRTLFIGEDSGYHVNNYLWAYNVDTKALTRILSTPAGAESTGLHAVDEINGFTYIMSNFQHPGDMKFVDAVKTAVAPLIKQNFNNNFSAAVGYLTFKA
ncbi:MULTISPECIES: PhoX family protein [unclassified Moraxella]|uniref:PhoX family protein n=1 Tax=unclassified Moraxella TaxID=2685852 RepID=UPI003AF7F277